MAKAISALKTQFEGTDPADQNDDVLDAVAALPAKTKVYSFTGRNGAGAVTLTGAAVGDVVLGVAGISSVGNAAASFEATISVINQIQQSSASDLSAVTYLVVLSTPA